MDKYFKLWQKLSVEGRIDIKKININQICNFMLEVFGVCYVMTTDDWACFLVPCIFRWSQPETGKQILACHLGLGLSRVALFCSRCCMLKYPELLEITQMTNVLLLWGWISLYLALNVLFICREEGCKEEKVVGVVGTNRMTLNNAKIKD